MTGTPMHFLSGAGMHPTLVRLQYPDGRFVARAKTAASTLPVNAAFAQQVGDEVWGILVDAGSPAANGTTTLVTTDDGRMFVAVITGEELVSGEPAASLAAARYWELPPDYVARLMIALDAEEEAPRDDAVSGTG